jgi:GNAT superfamily N-acetyltransferase
MAAPTVEVLQADLARVDHAEAVVRLLDMYSRDPAANGRGLSDEVRRELVPGLAGHAGTHVFLAYQGARALGVAVCFEGFSTFAARKLLNVHDLAVDEDARGAGVGQAMMNAIEARARALGCCKVTLEVQESNHPAQRLYARCGFAPFELAGDAGRAMLWQKKLA